MTEEYMVWVGYGGRGNRVVRFSYAETYQAAQKLATSMRSDSAPHIERWCEGCEDYHNSNRHRAAASMTPADWRAVTKTATEATARLNDRGA